MMNEQEITDHLSENVKALRMSARQTAFASIKSEVESELKMVVSLIEERKAKSARIKELEAENARLRQQRDAANAQLDWLLQQPEVSNGLTAKIQES
ncbi:TPA: hypothetical protein ACXKS0_004871 [Salmonella enterica]